MHFDYAYLEGDQINVRRANEGERIVTLVEKDLRSILPILSSATA